MAGYNVTLCRSCGAIYADNIPSQGEFDRYYAEMSKYEHAHLKGKISEVDAVRFAEVVDLIAPQVKRDNRVIDVGCATGALLAELKKRGFSNLQGYDPSKSCCEIAKNLYKVQVSHSTINDLRSLHGRADLVIMTGVLEHLADVDTSLNLLKGMLRPSGMLYFEVPDASRYDEWFGAPYQFFSMEHVNYFSSQSLSNLMARHGFSKKFVKRVKRSIGPNSIEPTIAGLFQLSPSEIKMKKDNVTKTALQTYLKKSKTLEKKIKSKIKKIVKKGKRMAIWGAGTHTLRLLKNSCLSEAKIVAFLDSNPNYHGKSLLGVPIEDPLKFNRPGVQVLISSQVHEAEIYKTITEKLQWPNTVHRLYRE